MTHDTLGAHLRAAREQAGLTVRDLAARAGITHPYLVRLENGEKRHPAADILMRLARALGIDDSELLAYIGVTPSLPEPRAYFRRKFGVDADEAEILARLIEEHQAQQRGEGPHEDEGNKD